MTEGCICKYSLEAQSKDARLRAFEQCHVQRWQWHTQRNVPVAVQLEHSLLKLT